MSQTATIIAEMRNSNRNAIIAWNATEDIRTDDRKAKVTRIQSATGTPFAHRTTVRLTATQEAAKHLLLKGLEGGRNDYKRDCSMPARAMSMASSRGRVRPDMLESLMSFFASPGALAESLLNSFLPARPSYSSLVAYLGENGIEATTAEISALKLFGGNRGVGSKGAPKRVSVFTPGAPIAETASKGRGRPSGPKFVGYLCTTQVANAAALLLAGDRTPYGCEDISGMPGGNDVMHAEGHDYGQDWDAAWMVGQPLTNAQQERKNIAYDASSHGHRTDAEGAIIETW